jgi:hypothetical protein
VDRRTRVFASFQDATLSTELAAPLAQQPKRNEPNLPQ